MDEVGLAALVQTVETIYREIALFFMTITEIQLTFQILIIRNQVDLNKILIIETTIIIRQVAKATTILTITTQTYLISISQVVTWVQGIKEGAVTIIIIVTSLTIM